MGYQVKKIIEFNQIEKKPVAILRGAILEKDDGKQVIQLKLCNTGKTILTQVTVKIICLGQDADILGIQIYTYDNLFVTVGDVFGTNIPIPLEYNDTESFSIEIEDIGKSLEVNSSKIKEINYGAILYNIFVGIIFSLGLIITLGLLWNLQFASALQFIPATLFSLPLICIYYSEDKQYKILKCLSVFAFILPSVSLFWDEWAQHQGEYDTLTNVNGTFIVILIWVFLIYVSIKKRKKDSALIIVLFLAFIVGISFPYNPSNKFKELTNALVEGIHYSYFNSYITVGEHRIIWKAIGLAPEGIGDNSLYYAVEQAKEQIIEMERAFKIGNIWRVSSILGIYVMSLYRLFRCHFQLLPLKRRIR